MNKIYYLMPLILMTGVLSSCSDDKEKHLVCKQNSTEVGCKMIVMSDSSKVDSNDDPEPNNNPSNSTNVGDNQPTTNTNDNQSIMSDIKPKPLVQEVAKVSMARIKTDGSPPILREKPNAESSELLKMPNGSKVKVVSKTKLCNTKNQCWVQIRMNNAVGYTFDKYLEYND